MQVLDRDLFSLDSVVDGDVVDRRGRKVRLRAIIQRRWGWPRSAADAAAEVLRAIHHPAAVRLELGTRRSEQQSAVLSAHPEIVTTLLEGLARGRVHRDEHEAGIEVQALEVHFEHAIQNLGLVGDVIDAVAQRLGEEVRDRVKVTAFVDDDEPVIQVTVPGDVG